MPHILYTQKHTCCLDQLGGCSYWPLLCFNQNLWSTSCNLFRLSDILVLTLLRDIENELKPNLHPKYGMFHVLQQIRHHNMILLQEQPVLILGIPLTFLVTNSTISYLKMLVSRLYTVIRCSRHKFLVSFTYPVDHLIGKLQQSASMIWPRFYCCDLN
jgi:hypothetical protein